MFEQNNIMAFLMAVLPVLLYSLMVYYLIPPTYVGNRRMRMYLFAGLLSPTIVYFLHFIFPLFNNSEIYFTFEEIVFCAFVQIALIEETSKFLMFSWVSSQRRNENQDLPIATAYYAMMSSAGFALIENVQYLMSFGNEILFIRCITAIVMHMICGLTMGYFIAKSKMMPTPDNSNMLNPKRIKRYLCIAFGILVATAIHGFYDLNLMVPSNSYPEITIIIILGLGLTLGYFMAKELISYSMAIRKNNKNVDIEK